jgi:hypothetical protein
MKNILTAALAGSLVMLSTPVKAREVAVDDGNDMLTVCNKPDSYSEGYCLGYIRALSTGVDVYLTTRKEKVCYGTNVTIGQLRDVVVDYVRRNPAKRDEQAITLVLLASAEAWPCNGV